jgi:hypothetical protein
MKKGKIILLSSIIFVITLAMMTIPILLPVLGVAGNVTYFNVTLIVNGGSPTITYVQPINDSPQEGGTKIVHFYFNATHPNGVGYIPASGAHVRINQSGVTLSESGCVVNATDSITLNRYDCNVTIYYYTLPGTWTINATIIDTGNNVATNTSVSYTNGNTYGITLKANSISVSGTPGQNSTAGTQYVNNTGNMNFTQINLTGINLVGPSVLGVGNFTANTTDGSGAGQSLVNNTPITLVNSSIPINSSRNIFLYVNIPAGLANGTYNSSNSWTVTVN